MTGESDCTTPLPAGWCPATLAEVTQINPPLPQLELTDDIDVSFLPMRSVEEETGRFDSSRTRTLGSVKRGYTPFVDGDVIFAKITPCMENGKMAVVSNLKNGIGFGSTEFHVLRAEEGILNRFLFFYLVQRSFRHEAQSKMTGSAGQKRVPAAFVEEAKIPIPPANEQERIVARIEELFTQLDAGVEELRKAHMRLKRYRQAVLQAAFRGELTRHWREAHKDELEPASVLLEHILEDRRIKWEADQILEMQAKGVTPRNDDWKKRYPEPGSRHYENRGLPEEWVRTNIGHVCVVVRGASPRPAGSPKYFGGHIPWITVGSLTADKTPFLTSVSQFVTQAGRKASRYIKPDTLLLTNSGATLGVPKITKIGGCINDGSVALLYSDYPLKLYLYYCLSEMTERLRQINQGAAQPNLNTSIVKAIEIPLPPLAEQEKIVSELERILSIIDSAEQTIEWGLKQAERLRQTILKRAFEGKLVAQDKNDEPAKLLLARIKPERAQREVEKQTTTKRKRLAKNRSKRRERPAA